jgi:hypothetical protein
LTIEILSYTTSMLNPVLKFIIFTGFVLSAVVFYQCWKKDGGVLHDISTLLLFGSIAGVLASAFRLQGDFLVQFKWGESIFDLILATLLLVISLVIRSKILQLNHQSGPGAGMP